MKISPMYDNIRLNIAITSDNHLDVNARNNKKRIKTVKKALTDAQKSVVPVDAYITVGDTTSRGTEANWECVKATFDGFNPAKQIIFTIGNHDCWEENKHLDYDKAIKNYLRYMNEICSQNLDRPYFSRDINGYKLIFLGITHIPSDEDCAAFDEAELSWLESELDSVDENKPIFVFCHQSINNNHGLPKTWDKTEEDWASYVGGIGKDSDRIKEIITKHKNIFYFSGHSHMGLCGENTLAEYGYASFETHDGVNYVNTPCLTRPNHHGETEKTGIGYLLEVYDDRVVIRPRSFTKRRMNKKIIIENGKPYFEKIIK